MLMLRRLPRLPRGRTAPLPDPLRERLLAIAASARAQRAIVPATARGIAVLDWLWATPWMPLAASFALSIALGLAWGNPYSIGAATVDRLELDLAPAAGRVRSEAVSIGAAAADLGRTVVAVFPAAGLRASRTVTASVAERLSDDDPSVAGPSAEQSSRRATRPK